MFTKARSNALQVTGIVLASVSLILIAIGGIQHRAAILHETQTACQQIELLKGAIRASITQSIATLGVKGTAGYQYYHAHPDELAQARSQAATELITFRARSC